MLYTIYFQHDGIINIICYKYLNIHQCIYITCCDFNNLCLTIQKLVVHKRLSLLFVQWLQRIGFSLGVGFLHLGVLVCRFNFMWKELDHMDNVIGFLNLFMVLKFVSLTKLSSNFGTSVTEIATKLLTIKGPVK